MTKNVKRFSDGFAIVLSPAQLDDIIGNTLVDLGYRVERHLFGGSVRYNISGEHGNIGRIVTSPLGGRRFDFGVEEEVAGNAERRKEAERIERAVLMAIWKQQNLDELIATGQKRMRQARVMGVDTPQAARLAMDELDLLRSAAHGGDIIELGYDGSVEDVEAYLERWIFEKVSLRDITELPGVGGRMERFPMYSWNGSESVPAGVVSIDGKFPGGRWYFYEQLEEKPRLFLTLDMLRVSYERATLKCRVLSEEGASIVAVLKAELSNNGLLVGEQQGSTRPSVPTGLPGSVQSLLPVSLNSTAGPYEPGEIYYVSEDVARRLIQADADIGAAKMLAGLTNKRRDMPSDREELPSLPPRPSRHGDFKKWKKTWRLVGPQLRTHTIEEMAKWLKEMHPSLPHSRQTLSKIIAWGEANKL